MQKIPLLFSSSFISLFPAGEGRGGLFPAARYHGSAVTDGSQSATRSGRHEERATGTQSVPTVHVFVSRRVTSPAVPTVMFWCVMVVFKY